MSAARVHHDARAGAALRPRRRLGHPRAELEEAAEERRRLARHSSPSPARRAAGRSRRRCARPTGAAPWPTRKRRRQHARLVRRLGLGRHRPARLQRRARTAGGACGRRWRRRAAAPGVGAGAASSTAATPADRTRGNAPQSTRRTSRRPWRPMAVFSDPDRTFAESAIRRRRLTFTTMRAITTQPRHRRQRPPRGCPRARRRSGHADGAGRRRRRLRNGPRNPERCVRPAAARARAADPGARESGSRSRAPQGSAFCAGRSGGGRGAGGPTPSPAPAAPPGNGTCAATAATPSAASAAATATPPNATCWSRRSPSRSPRRWASSGVLVETTTVVAKAWEQIERIGARAVWTPRTRADQRAPARSACWRPCWAASATWKCTSSIGVTDGPKPGAGRRAGRDLSHEAR